MNRVQEILQWGKKKFIYNLDKAKIVEMTNPKTKIKSHYLIL